MQETQPEITFAEETGYLLETPSGYLKATFDSQNQALNIDYVFVRQRRVGHGRELIRMALQKAVDLGAERITAKLVSREAIDTSRSVFGDAAVRVEYLGHYGQDERPPHLRIGTRGWLDYLVLQPQNLEVDLCN